MSCRKIKYLLHMEHKNSSKVLYQYQIPNIKLQINQKSEIKNQKQSSNSSSPLLNQEYLHNSHTCLH